ncbi:MAG TPA: endoribonuclease MazF [Thermoanaerobaculia bacterium]|nr:endoribonuclease MazF [Thermoanaerobaculia bacterium]
MVGGSYVPERGDLVWVTFSPQAGHEQAGRRPAAVLSARAYNERVGLGIFCPITSQAKGYPFEVAIPTGLRVGGVLLCDQVKSLDWVARRAVFLDSLPAATMAEAIEKLSLLLSLAPFARS